MNAKPTLLFISPQFLFPADAGGRIRSIGILQHLKGGVFSTRLLAPATAQEESAFAPAMRALADDVAYWRPAPKGAAWRVRRALGFLTPSPISAWSDADTRARRAVAAAIARQPDLIVFDYAQSLAMAPTPVRAPHIFFAHNVETEILARHAAVATGLMKHVWRREADKMRRFERRACAAAAGVIAVSARDAQIFATDFGARRADAIPTGVDPDYFTYAPPQVDAAPEIVFTGSMDWKANQDGLFWFMDEVWPLVAAARPDARFTVVGKNPPRAMIDAAARKGLAWRFTGFVEDVRVAARGAVYVIPLRVGGGTRIKAFEAMAMGVPVVSTALGVEGLDVRPDDHFLKADEAADFAAAVVRLLADADLRTRLASAARALVEENFSHRAAARIFEQHCLAILGAAR